MCNSRSRHSAWAETKVVPPLLLSTPFHSGVIPLHSGSLCLCSACPCHNLAKIAKSLFIFLFFSFLFLFILDLLHRRKCRKVSCHKCHTVTASHHMMSHDESHDRHGKIVYRLYSSCISSVENLMRTLSSSLCQSLNKGQLALFQLGV